MNQLAESLIIFEVESATDSLPLSSRVILYWPLSGEIKWAPSSVLIHRSTHQAVPCSCPRRCKGKARTMACERKCFDPPHVCAGTLLELVFAFVPTAECKGYVCDNALREEGENMRCSCFFFLNGTIMFIIIRSEFYAPFNNGNINRL